MRRTSELMKDKSGQLLRRGIFAIWLIVLLGSMSIMLVYASQKTIEITDSAIEGKQELGNQAESTQTRPLSIKTTPEQEMQFLIPLQENVQADAVTVENRYMDKELWITIAGITTQAYTDQMITGRTSVVEEGYIEQHEDSVILKFHVSDVYEYRTTLNDECLTVKYHEPHELYKTVVVVNAACADNEGADATETVENTVWEEQALTVAVAKKLQQQFAHEEVKVYYVGLEDVTVSNEKILDLVENVRADAFVALGAESDIDADYGIAGYYNDTYYITGYGNVDVADAFTRNVTISSKNKAKGLFAVGQEDLLRQIKVPAARISLGSLRHEKEGKLLGEEQYRDKLAQGLSQAILEMHEALHFSEQ